MKKLLLIILPILIGLATATSDFAADQSAIATVLSAPPAADIGTKTKCGVCGMNVRVKASTPGAVYQGKDYYFCDANERDAFVQSPSMYVKK